MHLRAYLETHPHALVKGYCRGCGYSGEGKRFEARRKHTAIYLCPNCRSLGFRIDNVSLASTTGQTVTIYERRFF